MGIRASQPAYLKKPLLLFGIGFLFCSLLVIVAFDLTSSWLLQTTVWRPYVAAIPGVVLSGFFIPLFLYMRHNDELVKKITTKSLATACVLGLSAHVVSMTRATIGGYPEFDGAIVVAVMASTFLVVAMFLSWKHR
jgi:hypothetical protein